MSNPASSQGMMQAGVDLGTAMDESDELARRASKKQAGGKRRGGSAKPADITAEIRPKRRAPLSKILLVGGATRMPSVPRFLQNMTGTQPVATNLDPDQVSPPALAMCPQTICVTVWEVAAWVTAASAQV